MKAFLRFANTSPLFDYGDLLSQFIDHAIREDVGCGDLTSLATIPHSHNSQAQFLVKEDCMLAGIQLASFIFKKIDPALQFTIHHNDGEFVKAGTMVGVVKGDVQAILKAERLTLNCMQRMSGIATKTRQLVDLAAPHQVTILDTRKTTPNFRICEKWAVAIGGAMNHRFGLYDQILIKDNHIKYVGGIAEALQNVSNYLLANNLSVPVIVEVQNETEFAIAIQHAFVNRILMDNFKPTEIREIVSRYTFHQHLEASGGIDGDNIKAYLESGIHFISIGHLTHHITSIDISLKVE